MTIGNLIFNVAANTAQLQQDVAKVNTSLDRMQGMAMKVAKGLAGAFTVTAIARYIGHVIQTAAQLHQLSEKTGISVVALQALEEAAHASGTTLDQVTAAITQMQLRLSSGASFAGLRELNVSVSALRGLRPEEQFITIAKAIAGIKDPVKRARLAYEVFGKSGTAILSTLRSDIEEVVEAHKGMSKNTVDTLREAGEAWRKFWSGTKDVVSGVTATVISSLGSVKAWIESVNEAIHIAAGNISRSSGMPQIPSAPSAPGAGLPTIDVDAAEKAFERLHGTIGQQLAKVKKAMEEAKDEAERLAGAIATVERHGYDGSIAMRIMAAELQNVGTSAEVARHPLLDTVEAIEALDKDVEKSIKIFRATGAGLENIGEQAQVVVPKLKTLGDRMRSAFDDVAMILDNIPGKLAEIGAVAARTGSAIMKNLASGNIWGAVVAGVTGAITVLGKLFGSGERGKVRKMYDEFINASGGVEKLAAKSRLANFDLARLFNARKVKEFEAAVAELERRLDLQKATWEKVKAAVERYKFTLEELGPALQGQMLDEQAQQIFEDFMLLTGAGIALETVLAKMAPDINKMVQAYIAAGIAIPDALRPIIEQMMALGLLVDANGNVITDLEEAGITFTLSMSQGMQGIIDALKEMIDLLKQFLGLTESIPDDFTLPPPNDPGSGTTDDSGIDHPGFPMAHGGFGRVTRPTLFLAGEAGAEDFAFSGGGRRFGGSGGDGAPTSIHVYIDGEEVSARVERRMDAHYRRTHRVRAA